MEEEKIFESWHVKCPACLVVDFVSTKNTECRKCGSKNIYPLTGKKYKNLQMDLNFSY